MPGTVCFHIAASTRLRAAITPHYYMLEFNSLFVFLTFKNFIFNDCVKSLYIVSFYLLFVS